jgi:glycosyltransferase involved in cell wall biosynthesis
MRIGAAWVPGSNSYYRAIGPLVAMQRRGHEIVPAQVDGAAHLHRLQGCDVVHVYRRADDATRQVLAQLGRRGTAITFDNDDDLTAVPRESPDYRRYGGSRGRRLFAASVKAARAARLFTTTNEALARKYRAAGVRRVEVVGNYLRPDVDRSRRPHDGVVIGWVAGLDHLADVARIDVADALRRIVDERDDVRVECIGVDLRLPERYRHDPVVDFHALPGRIAGFDVGIAPLADLPCNHVRSDIKVKEYAASGVPWLASPVGPYEQLGEGQGGRLVADDGWFQALGRLVASADERRRLGEAGRAWAASQTMDAMAHRWEQVFKRAAGRQVAA